MTPSETLLQTLTKSMETEPDSWRVGLYVVEHKGGLTLWIGDRGYVRLCDTVEGSPWGFFQRRRLRKAVAALVIHKARKTIE